MITLLAAAPDGWGIALEGDAHWLVRPPYRQADRARIRISQVQRALADEDFSPTDIEFEDWGELCRHLQREVVEQASPEQLESAQSAALRLLGHATREHAVRHLEQLRDALTRHPPQRVEAALIALLGAEAVRGDPALVAEVGELLERVHRLRSRIRASHSPQKAWSVADEPGLELVAARIREQGSVFGHAA